MEVVAAGITVRMIVLFVIAVAGQIGGSLLLGRTDGWTNPLWSAICVAVYAPSFWAIATLIREGGPLSLIMPLLAAVVPLAVALIAVLVLGEAASWARLGLLVFACAVIGVAGAV
jgi:quaternary ammonium compound-resistance protein SugE